MKKNYNVTDLEMIDRAKDFHASLTVDLADFTALDPKFTAGYLTLFNATINASVAAPTIGQERGELRLITEDVLAKATVLTSQLKGLKYFVDTAWNGNEAKQAEFALDELYKSGRKQEGLVKLGRLAHTKATEYATTLDAIGYTAAKLTELNDAQVNMDVANDVQDEFINTQKRRTEERTTKHNATYKYMQEIHKAAQIVYAGDEASLGRYKLPNNDTGYPTLELDLAAGGTVSPYNFAFEPTTKFLIENESGVELLVCTRPQDGEACTVGSGLTILADESRIFTIAETGEPVQLFLSVTNASETLPASFSIKRL